MCQPEPTKHSISGRSKDEVSVEQFQEAFRDIGAACIPLEACSWEAGRPRENGKLEVVDADEGKDNELFAGVVSCLG